MFRRLLIVIFILQSIALNAMASTNMSQFNQAEKIKMQIMHQTLSNSVTSLHTDCPSIQDSSASHCCDNEKEPCHNLVCNSIHTAHLFDIKLPSSIQSPILLNETILPFSVLVPIITLQPETPPPLV